MEETVMLRVHGDPARPTLIYLPGLHGDWTLVTGFRRALGDRVRFVEMTYPRTVSWSLDQYAEAIGKALVAAGIRDGWVLAESFGSQVVWPLVTGRNFKAQGIILAGGFGRHALRWGVWMAYNLFRLFPLGSLNLAVGAYANIAKWRFRRSPELLKSIEEFVARRTEPDRAAATHRLHLILHNDPAIACRQCQVPVFAFSGLVDPIVPWIHARWWLRTHCPALRDYQLVWRADHNVLGTAPDSSARIVLGWMNC